MLNSWLSCGVFRSSRKNITRSIWLACLVLGCAKDPVSKSSTNNSNISIDLLFEHDGVKVYRFFDNGHYIYYTDARGKTEWVQKEGKTSRIVEVETVDIK